MPSPEEKARTAASQVFTAQLVKMDVTGSGFQRMTQFRRSLQHCDYVESSQQQSDSHRNHQQKLRKKSKKRSAKKRRNTIACDGDRRDIQSALTLVDNAHNDATHRLERYSFHVLFFTHPDKRFDAFFMRLTSDKRKK